MIKIEHVTKRFGSQVVLDDLSLTVEKGELLVIVGPSGTGKSVLLKHMVGLYQPDGGTIEINGVDITRLSERELLKLRRNFGYLFQEGALYDFMDVFENIAFPIREHTRWPENKVSARVKAILEMVDLPQAAHKMPMDLSGGMKKRVGLARAIATDAKILFCDEPTSGLDPVRSRDISDLIRQVSRKLGCTTVITSHDIDNTLRIADRVALLENGRIAVIGTGAEITASTLPAAREFFAPAIAKST